MLKSKTTTTNSDPTHQLALMVAEAINDDVEVISVEYDDITPGGPEGLITFKKEGVEYYCSVMRKNW